MADFATGPGPAPAREEEMQGSSQPSVFRARQWVLRHGSSSAQLGAYRGGHLPNTRCGPLHVLGPLIVAHQVLSPKALQEALISTADFVTGPGPPPAREEETQASS